MRIRTAVIITLAALLALGGLTQVAGDGHKRGPGEGVMEPKPADSIMALPPKDVLRLLSGRAWLITSGLDPALALGGRTGITPAKGIGDVSGSSTAGGLRLQAPAAASVPFRDPSQKFSRNILISQDFSEFPFQTEPTLAVDPKDPDHIVVGLIDFNFPSVTSYVTIDGGATWEGPFQVKFPQQDLGSAGDPIVAFDRDGTVHYANISLQVKDFQIGPVIGSGTVSNISVSTSGDGGFTWPLSKVAARSGIKTRLTSPAAIRTRGEIEVEFLDKPWMVVGPHYQDPTRDVIYVTYTNFITTFELFWTDELPFLGNAVNDTVIEMVRSEDGGVTWSDPVAVSPRVRFDFPIGTSERVVQGSRPVVAPDGTLYVTWLDSTQDGAFEGLAELYVARSDDGGRTFADPVLATSYLEPKFAPRSGFFRMWGTTFPRIAVGPQGEVYLVTTAIPPDNSEDEGDIFFVRSEDQGRTWSPRVRLNDDGTGRLQFFPEIAVSPDGTVHAMWGDMRDDPVENSYHIYYASSEDGGRTWSINSRVTDFPSNPNLAFPSGQFIGDYFGITATEDDVYMAWADSRLGELGPANQKIGFARQRLMPSPSIFLSPPSGTAGRDIVIQGANFQPDRNLFIEVAGVIVASGRTNENGQFNTRIFIPISGEGTQPVRVFDESGNVARASFFTDFGFDNVKAGLERLPLLEDRVDAAEEGITASLETQQRELNQALESAAAGLETEIGAMGKATEAQLQKIQGDQRTSAASAGAALGEIQRAQRTSAASVDAQLGKIQQSLDARAASVDAQLVELALALQDLRDEQDTTTTWLWGLTAAVASLGSLLVAGGVAVMVARRRTRLPR